MVTRANETPLCKIVHRDDWEVAKANGIFAGAGLDLVDGYIHLCSLSQAAGVLSAHFENQGDLLLVVVDPDRATGSILWEVSRGGDTFPHLYGELPMTAVVAVHEIPTRFDPADTAK